MNKSIVLLKKGFTSVNLNSKLWLRERYNTKKIHVNKNKIPISSQVADKEIDKNNFLKDKSVVSIFRIPVS